MQKGALGAPLRGLVVASLVVLALSVAAVGYTLLRLRDAALQDMRRDADNVAVMLAEQTLRSTQAIDLALSQAQAEIERAAPRDAAELNTLVAGGAMRAQLRRHLNHLSQAEVVAILNGKGRIASSTRGAAGARPHASAGADVSQSRIFAALRSARESELVVSGPTTSRVSGHPTIYFGRKIVFADGSFAGGVVVGVALSYYEHLFNSIQNLRGMTSLFASDDGRVLTGSSSWIASGASVAGSSRWRAALAAGRGEFVERGADGERLVIVRPVSDLPLAVAIGVNRSALLADWRLRASLIAAGAIFIALIAAGLLLGFIRQHGALARSEAGLRDKERQLEAANRNFEAALNNMPIGICLFDPDRRVSVFNKAYRDMYGLHEGELRSGATLQELVDLRVRKGLFAADYVEDVMQPATEAQHVIRSLRDGRVFEVSRLPMPDGARLTVHADVTQARETRERIQRLAERDSLTGLANRALLAVRLEDFATRLRTSGEAFSALMLDMDNFKPVNDTLGHAVGDLLLREVADRLIACVSEDAVISRFGGDEFVILVRSADRAEIEDLASRIICAIRRPFRCDGHALSVGVSIGVALVDQSNEACKALQRADLALYRAKSSGRNAWRFFSPEMEAEALFRRQVERDLEQGIDAGELVVDFQPLVNIVTGEPLGAEALVRWNHPALGLLEPDRFIPVAEDCGMVGRLGFWVLQRACAEAARWPGQSVSVNLSPRQFTSRQVVDDVAKALASTGLPAQRLLLEITESALLSQSRETIAALDELRAMGVSVALDDFGAGYSSLAYLREFRFDVVKIDRSFVAEVESRRDNAAIVQAITGLARSLEIRVVAEGVETEEQRALLTAAGCGYAQGFLFSQPVSADEIGAIFAARREDRAA